MMRKTFFTLILAVLSMAIFAQNSNGFKYQAVLRNADGEIISNENVALKISILSQSEDGEVAYSEEHQTSTTELGLIVLVIGEGDVLSGAFNEINWSETSNFLKIELNRNGSGYETMGTAPLLSVPYALHAKTASNVDDADADPANEIQILSISGNTISISNGGSIELPGSGGDISGQLDSLTVDKLKGREISTNIPADGQLLKWNEAQQKWMPADDGLGAEGTMDGVVSSVGVTGATTKTMTFTRSNGLGTLTTSFDISDADADPTNEIQTLSYNNDTLYLTNGGAVNIAGGGSGFSGDYNDLENKPVLSGDVSGELDSTVVTKIQGQNFSAGDPENGQVLKWNGSAWAPGSDAVVGGSDTDGVVETMSVTTVGNTKTITLGLSNSAPSSSLNADFTDNINDADADPANEIQDLELINNILTITGNNSATDIDLSTYDNTDNQTLNIDGDSLVISNGNKVSLKQYLDNTDTQGLILTDDVLSIENGTGSVDLSTYIDDADADATNEIQMLSIIGDTIALTKNGGKVTLPAKGWGGASDEALFAVVNSAGDTVFAVYEGGVQIFVDETNSKAARNGFAVASRSATKGITEDILTVTKESFNVILDTTNSKAARNGFAVASRSAAKGAVDLLSINDDSVRFYIDGSDSKAARNGFAVASRSASKGITEEILTINDKSFNIVLDSADAKAARNGFAVASRSASKSGSVDILNVNEDSVRIYISDGVSKAARNGFAVASRSAAKSGGSDYFNINTSTNPEVIVDESRIVFYPNKDAFMAGTINVPDPDSVGLNSANIGFQNTAKGQYAQAFGYQSTARGNYSMAVGKNALAANINSFAFGEDAQAYGDESYAFGRGATAYGFRSFAFGSAGVDSAGSPTGVATAKGDYSFAIGQGTITGIDYDDCPPANPKYHLTQQEWYDLYYSGTGSVAIGVGDSSLASHATTIGYYNTATYRGVALGYKNKVYGKGGTISGGSTNILNEGAGSAVISGGYDNIINTNSYYSAICGGAYNQIYENNATILGGVFNSAYGVGSVIGGSYNRAYSKYETVIGFNNDYDESGSANSWVLTDPLFVIGNGSNLQTKSNAMVVYKSGNTDIYGELYVEDQVGIGITTPNSRLHINSDIGQDPLRVQVGSNSKLAVLSNGGTVMGTYSETAPANGLYVLGSVGIGTANPGYKLTVSGTAWCTAGAWASDRRLKRNITNLMQGSLDKLLRLNAVSFEWNNPLDDGMEGEQMGFIAQEVEEIFPSMVLTANNEEKTKSIKSAELFPVMVSAMQEQQQIIQEQNSRIENLELELEKLKALILQMNK